MQKEFVYKFRFPESDHKDLIYKFAIDKKTLSYVDLSEEEGGEASPWTDFTYCQCQNCPIKSEEQQKCPVALNLFGLVQFFRKFKSYEEALIEVETSDRVYSKKASIQEGLYSIFGAIMATSNCPHMYFFRPLAWFHLPFASEEETIYRSLSNFSLSGSFSDSSDVFKLEDIQEIYNEVKDINRGILKRINKIDFIEDAEKNALVILDAFCSFLEYSKGSNWQNIRDLFYKK